ncbi:hypothetical protein KSP39_PZI019231 [Platanthera zijinensis]|uniref:Uncharacterized protein n=1 Tax=Platanthera zijinensis TaxID=2320716 RepID=A0AAP0B294_9ASPA
MAMLLMRSLIPDIECSWIGMNVAASSRIGFYHDVLRQCRCIFCTMFKSLWSSPLLKPGHYPSTWRSPCSPQAKPEPLPHGAALKPTWINMEQPIHLWSSL